MPEGFSDNANVQTSYRTVLNKRLPGEAWDGSNALDDIPGDCHAGNDRRDIASGTV